MIFLGDWAPLRRRTDVTFGPGTFLLNVEGPILPEGHGLTPCAKAGPNLFSSTLPKCRGLPVCSLANNHTMDYGAAGLEATLEAIAHAGGRYVGAGMNQKEAQNPVVIMDGDTQVGVIGCCEPQFGVATATRPGVAAWGPWVSDLVEEMSSRVDHVVISVHAAMEDSPWPSPRLQELYRSYIRAGATVVHGHHAHLPQGFEEYEGGLILYGLGNWVVDPNAWRHFKNGLWSLVSELDWARLPEGIRFKMGTVSESTQGIVSASETPQDSWSVGGYMETANRPLQDGQLLEGLWQEASVRAYLHHYAGYFKRIWGRQDTTTKSPTRWLHWLKSRRSVKETAGVQPDHGGELLGHVLFACDSHRDAVATAFGVLGGELEDLRTEETRRLADEMMPWSVGGVSS